MSSPTKDKSRASGSEGTMKSSSQDSTQESSLIRDGSSKSPVMRHLSPPPTALEDISPELSHVIDEWSGQDSPFSPQDSQDFEARVMKNEFDVHSLGYVTSLPEIEDELNADTES
ncbi:hypothetical protein PV08_07120 [Exophiala spinifera]|uniref:Uncharacterized protein n=1 Tax=Exophiala spinifera TaxID=91928 RepID=A0A0D2B601_9EURO|nr:uncharacterized protein PV08_07120 [Exophiala spinifera]KIW14338.1 hypothetical protein PV08_07120 [Exophiala spinifera]